MYYRSIAYTIAGLSVIVAIFPLAEIFHLESASPDTTIRGMERSGARTLLIGVDVEERHVFDFVLVLQSFKLSESRRPHDEDGGQLWPFGSLVVTSS